MLNKLRKSTSISHISIKGKSYRKNSIFSQLLFLLLKKNEYFCGLKPIIENEIQNTLCFPLIFAYVGTTKVVVTC